MIVAHLRDFGLHIDRSCSTLADDVCVGVEEHCRRVTEFMRGFDDVRPCPPSFGRVNPCAALEIRGTDYVLAGAESRVSLSSSVTTRSSSSTSGLSVVSRNAEARAR